MACPSPFQLKKKKKKKPYLLQVYEVLFKLSGSNELKVREGAQQVLQLLPTHPGILADFYWILEAKGADEVHDLLDQLFRVKERLLYTLQVSFGKADAVWYSGLDGCQGKGGACECKVSMLCLGSDLA
jgi:hypothetical protein